MYSSPTIFFAKLLAAMQVLMTLDMPLSTTLALPVTSKPIESTVENLAWQAWIELPPEQKQQVKSRKVTPKSIFTLPLRVECPEGHKQVDRKCIPIAIGSNDVLIDLSALGLLVGNTPTEDVYDYDDMGEELANPLAFGSEMPASIAVKSSDGSAIDLKPPAKDEPLKFNIFQNKFHIFHEEPLEDYAALSNEGLQSSEKEQHRTATTPATTNAAVNGTFLKDLVSEASNFSESIGEFFDQLSNKASATDNANEQSQSSLNLDDDIDFKIEAISIPAFGNHSSIQLVTTIMDTGTTTNLNEHDKQADNDLTTLLQTESFLPLLNHTTATTLQTAMPLREPSDSYFDLLSIDNDEEITTLTTPMQKNSMVVKNKQEYTRSVTLNPISAQDNDGSAVEASGDSDRLGESTLETVTNDDTSETTTPIQLDDTTIIESHSSLSATAAAQQELKELLLQEEQALKTVAELQHTSKCQKDQQVVLKKSKVQPVEVLSTTTETATTTTAAGAAEAVITTATSLPSATNNVDELLLTTTETATPPLLASHNENENNDRFYYQNLAKQGNEAKLHSGEQFKENTAVENTAAAENAAEASSLVVVAVNGQPTTTTTTTTASTTTKKATETIPLTSEIDPAEELRLINELVKGIRKPTTLTAITKMPTATATSTTTSTTTTSTTTTTTPTPTLYENIESSLSSSSLSESTSSVIKNSTLTTSQIWSKILPLLTTTTTTPKPKNSTYESLSESQQEESNVTQPLEATTRSSASSERSNRNSKIIRINGFNKISAAKYKIKNFTNTETTVATTTAAEELTSYSSTTSSSSSSPVSSTTENLPYEPYWWLPAAWRLDKPTSTEKLPKEQNTAETEQQPLLLRFWSHYVPRAS